MASRTSARFSTYSGAPSLQPSLAPTYGSSQNQTSSGNSQLQPASEKMYNDPSALASSSTLSSTSDPKAADIKHWSGALERMQDERLDKQRYTMSTNKSDEVSKLALGAKVERALSRRMTGQDATFSPNTGRKQQQQKRTKEVEAN